MVRRKIYLFITLILLLTVNGSCKKDIKEENSQDPAVEKEENNESSSGAPLELTILTMDNFRPYGWLEAGQPAGIDIDIIKEVERRTNIKFNIGFVPWKRLLHNTQTGQCDGAFSAFWTPERTVYAIYTAVPIHISTFKIFVKKGNEFSYNSIEDLYGKRLAKMRGFSVSEEFDRAEKDKLIHVDESDRFEDSIKKVMLGRIEGFVGNQHVVAYNLKKMGYLDKIVALDKPLTESREAYLIISKAKDIPNKRELIEQINKTLLIMKGDGTLDRITNTYIQ